MATYTRNDAWNNGGAFDNPDLLWYAKGVGVMMSRALESTDSWWFFAAIHGEYITSGDTEFPGWAYISGPPSVPTSPLPSQNIQELYWNQCQHQSWFFPPWHRGYLLALEAHIRAAVVGLGGPETWALPYWNYLGEGDHYEIPPAFTEELLPDGNANPLFVTARYGPNGDGNIFIPIPPVSPACQTNNLYTGSNQSTPRPGYGGPETGFSHGGSRSGNLESNPHNQVHVDVGGTAPGGKTWGLMSDPGLAALDPVFYFHHSNIDRMWAEWNGSGNGNPNSANWMNGPAAGGEREFVMPMPDGTAWKFTPGDVDSLTKVDYTYEGLAPAAPPARDMFTQRLERLGATETTEAMSAQKSKADTATDSELLGAHDGALKLKSSGARATVKLDAGVRKRIATNLESASTVAPPDRAYLQLENVRGTQDAHKLSVYVNGQLAGTEALFGLRKASKADDHHAGSGLTFELDVTGIIDALYLEDGLNVDSLDVRIVPHGAISDGAEISVGRVSVHREGHQ